MAKSQLPARLIPISEISMPKDRQLAVLRGRVRASNAVLNALADLAFGVDRAERPFTMEGVLHG